jgi:hypothetical protein
MSEKMQLPQLEPAAFTAGLLLQKEWYMDPPPMIMQALPEDILFGIHRIRLQGLAEIADLQSKMKAVEARVLAEVAEAMP